MAQVGGIGTFDKSMNCAAFGGLIAVIGMIAGVRIMPVIKVEALFSTDHYLDVAYVGRHTPKCHHGHYEERPDHSWHSSRIGSAVRLISCIIIYS
jgi:hypothetical protein